MYGESSKKTRIFYGQSGPVRPDRKQMWKFWPILNKWKRLRGLGRGYVIFQFGNLVKAVNGWVCSALCNVCITTGIYFAPLLVALHNVKMHICKMLHNVNINFSLLVQCAYREPSNGGGWYSNIQYLCAMTQQDMEFFTYCMKNRNCHFFQVWQKNPKQLVYWFCLRLGCHRLWIDERN